MQFTIISAYFFFIKLNFFLFLLDLILIMNLCKILYTVVSAALAQRSFYIKNHFFLRFIL